MFFKIRSIDELIRFSENRHLGGEKKTVRCFRKKIYFKEREFNELRQTVLLKQLS